MKRRNNFLALAITMVSSAAALAADVPGKNAMWEACQGSTSPGLTSAAARVQCFKDAMRESVTSEAAAKRQTNLGAGAGKIISNHSYSDPESGATITGARIQNWELEGADSNVASTPCSGANVISISKTVTAQNSSGVANSVQSAPLRSLVAGKYVANNVESHDEYVAVTPGANIDAVVRSAINLSDVVDGATGTATAQCGSTNCYLRCLTSGSSISVCGFSGGGVCYTGGTHYTSITAYQGESLLAAAMNCKTFASPGNVDGYTFGSAPDYVQYQPAANTASIVYADPTKAAWNYSVYIPAQRHIVANTNYTDTHTNHTSDTFDPRCKPQ